MEADSSMSSRSESDEGSTIEITDISLKDLQFKLAEFARVRDWDQFHSPRNLLLALVGEVGELSEIFQWKGEVERGLPDWNNSEKEHLGEELSDVLLFGEAGRHMWGGSRPSSHEENS